MPVDFSHTHLEYDRPIPRTGSTALHFIQP